MKKTALRITFILALLFSTVTLFGSVAANPIPPTTRFRILSPLNNETYLADSVFVNFTVTTYEGTAASYIGIPTIQCYVDGELYQQINLTDLTDSTVGYSSMNFSISLSGLSSGQHSVSVSKTANYDLILGNSSEAYASGKYYFSVIVPPRISLMSPQNQSYNTANIPLNYSTFVEYGAISWMGYSLDEKDNVTLTGNITLTDLPSGEHSLIVYATNEDGNTGASETITFNVAKPGPQPEPFPVASIATASIASAGIIAVGLLLYFKRCKG
jgi:hypothetical protein